MVCHTLPWRPSSIRGPQIILGHVQPLGSASFCRDQQPKLDGFPYQLQLVKHFLTKLTSASQTSAFLWPCHPESLPPPGCPSRSRSHRCPASGSPPPKRWRQLQVLQVEGCHVATRLCVHSCAYGCIHVCIYGCLVWMHTCMYSWMDGYMDGCDCILHAYDILGVCTLLQQSWLYTCACNMRLGVYTSHTDEHNLHSSIYLRQKRSCNKYHKDVTWSSAILNAWPTILAGPALAPMDSHDGNGFSGARPFNPSSNCSWWTTCADSFIYEYLVYACMMYVYTEVALPKLMHILLQPALANNNVNLHRSLVKSYLLTLPVVYPCFPEEQHSSVTFPRFAHPKDSKTFHLSA